MLKQLEKIVALVEKNRAVSEDVALGVGTFAVALGASGDLSLSAVSGAAVAGGKAAVRAGLDQLLGWAASRKPAVAAPPVAPPAAPTPPA